MNLRTRLVCIWANKYTLWFTILAIISIILSIMGFWNGEILWAMFWAVLLVVACYIALGTHFNTVEACYMAASKLAEGKWGQVEILAQSSYCCRVGCLIVLKQVVLELEKIDY